MDACPLCLGQAGKGGEESVRGITWALICLSVGNVSCIHKHTTCKRKADGMQKEDKKQINLPQANGWKVKPSSMGNGQILPGLFHFKLLEGMLLA